ncbi:hypothetical protein EBB07_17700 [Paenibacillaceae bacterium]|nr:hypothetical protein EBB07_17700 [Paenibacillaceae bacterium]
MTARQLVKDWPSIKVKAQTVPWAKHIVEQFKPATDWWVAHYEDDPARVAGWGHHYFCDKCFAELVFDPVMPTEHKCSSCGELRSDEEVNDAWCYIYRSNVSSQMFNAAVLYHLYGDEDYLAFIRKVLAFYCDHYGTFKVRTPPGQEGMFSGTDLTDAVGVIWMLNGLELIKEHLSAEELDMYKQRFFLPEAAFLIEKVGCTPNIICWMKAAAGMIGLFFNERVWCERAAEGEYGIKKKLADGLLPEGIWYEGSFHYHFYCAEGMTYYLAFCKIYDYSFPQMEEGLLAMYRYPVRFSFPNGRFPSPNDGWPLLGFSNYAHQYEWMRNVYDEAPFRYALAQCYTDREEQAMKDAMSTNSGGVPRLLFGRDWRLEWERETTEDSPYPNTTAQLDKDIYFTMLKNDTAAVFMKYGFVLRGHSHADVMNIEIYLKDEIVSRDISNSGYGSDLFREWQRKTIAHNSIMVDGQNQPNRPRGELISFDEAGNRCRAAADEVYPGVRYIRDIQLLANGLQDVFEVETTAAADDAQHTFDWFFHCSGELQHRLPLTRAAQPGDADGYQLMQETAACEVNGDWEMSWVLPGKKVTLKMAGCPGTTVYVFKGYEHRMDWMRWGVMVRRSGISAQFAASYHFEISE